ncbi:hypothetical protein B0H14DRAFT_2820497 [Mycena olivaceomarginata]|nr:hypothetical protein B0H14DRAFT_2820497 [Mycena olivaceomarginata]
MTNLSMRDGSRRLASPGDILPVELWELIFRHIEIDPELLLLARVCSTFNAVSIRLLLARHGQGQDVFDCTSLQLSVHTLPALYLSLQSFSATRVTCSLDRAETRWNDIGHLLDALLTRTPNLRRLDLEFGHDLLGDLASVDRAFRDMVGSMVHRTTGPVFISWEMKYSAVGLVMVTPGICQCSNLFLCLPIEGRRRQAHGVKRIRERFGRKLVPKYTSPSSSSESTTGRILLHTGDISPCCLDTARRRQQRSPMCATDPKSG